MARLAMPAPADLDAQQQEVCAEAIAGKRGKVPAPMIAWIRNPELARRAQRLGELMRYDTTLEPALSEMAILVCARHWTSHVEWNAHKRLALEAGLDPAIVAAIAQGREPVLPSARAQSVYEVAHTVLATGQVPEPMYRRAVEHLGERGVVELVGILGYYCFVSLTLNTFELGLPEGIAADLADPAAA